MRVAATATSAKLPCVGICSTERRKIQECAGDSFPTCVSCFMKNMGAASSKRYSNPKAREEHAERMKLWWAERKNSIH